MPASADFPLTRAVAARLVVRDSSSSTNAELRENADGAPHLTVLLTTDQTAGRGRIDRTWQTPRGAALAVSILLRDLPEPVDIGWIPLVAGVAMADAVAGLLPDHAVGVKWPNDVLVDGRKICGILAEGTGDAVVLGAGVNTAMTAEQLPVPTAVSFGTLGLDVDPDALAAAFVERLGALVAQLRSGGGAAVHDLVQERCLSIGRDIDVSLPDGTSLRGRGTALESDGRLVVVADDGRALTVAAGDVVHARLS